MERQKLRQHKRNKAELESVNNTLDRLREQLNDVEIVSGKVSKSSDEFPYIEEHLTVKVSDPKKADPIKERIRKKEKRKAELEVDILEVEEFIAGMPEGIEKQIFEMIYLYGMTQQEVGSILHCERSGISKKIDGYLKDSQHSHF